MVSEIFKLVLQFVILGIMGGAITFYYNKLQKNREIVISIINQISAIHTDFLSLRYKFNALFTNPGKPIRDILEQNEIAKLKWQHYEEACLLLSKFQSLKPLLLKFLPEHKDEIGEMDNYYQNYRRSIRSNQPVFQDKRGNTGSGLKNLKDLHRDLINELTNKI